MDTIRRTALVALTFFAATMLAGCGRATSKSPLFEWNGLRAGMRVSELESRSDIKFPWQHSALIAGTVLYDRQTSMLIPGYGPARLQIVADTVDDKVLELRYASTEPDAQFESEMEALAASWDKISGFTRKQFGQDPGPYHVEWTTADGLWSGEIHYGKGESAGPNRPVGFRSKELKGMERALMRMMR